MSNLSTFNAIVDEIIQDDADILKSNEVDGFITSALSTYSKDRPLKKVKEYSGDGNYDYSLPSDWIEEFSGVIGDIEYPAGYQIPEYLPFEDWIIHETESGKKLRFLKDTPSAAQTFILRYTAPHTVNGSTSTVYADDEQVFCYLAASLCLMAMANRYAQHSDSTIGADVVTYRTKTDMYAARAKEHLKKYLDHVFEREPMKAAVMIKEFDTGFLWNGRHLTHDPDFR